jgi:hypothetical protein
MPDVHIDKLVVKAGAMDPKAAQRLAEQIVSALERAPIAADLPQRAELIRLQVRPKLGTTPDHLTQQILAELLRELRRS